MMKKFWVGLFLGLLLIVLGGAIGLWRYVHLPASFPIRSVQVVGEYQFVKPEVLQHVVLPFISKGFFNLNVAGAQAALTQIPGIDSASVRRVWPDAIKIQVSEEKPEATLPDGRIYSADGRVFQPMVSRDLSALPVFAGSIEDLPAIQEFYHSAEFLAVKSGFQITFVGCDGLGSWTLMLQRSVSSSDQKISITVILGKDRPLERLSRFLSHYPMLEASDSGKIPVSVDLRYNMGFSAKY
jgi:cell division protein FtsQ